MSELPDITELIGNEFFVGLVAASALGGGIFCLRFVWAAVRSLLLHQCTVEMRLRNDDPSFDWVNNWLARHRYAARARRLSLMTMGAHHFFDNIENNQWILVPGQGIHWFRHAGAWIWLNREVGEGKPIGGRVQETITMRVLGRNQAALTGVVGEARALMQTVDGVRVFMWRQTYWSLVATKRRRKMSSLVLRRGQIERITADADWFFGAQGWYEERGVPYRRGYLFHGVPGTGKTSLASALAAHYNRPLYVLSLGSISSDQQIADALSEADPDSIVLIEDIDAAGVTKPRRAPVSNGGAPQEAGAPSPDVADIGTTLSGLLNAIDGAAAAEGRLLIMTTNHADRLDPALIRSGRADLKEQFDLADADMVGQMFATFYPGHPLFARRARDAFNGGCLSPADVQALFMRHADDPSGALDRVVASVHG